MTNHIPIITIDGPGGSGKGTLGHLLAQRLGWHVLDSGAIYRLLAFSAQKHAIDLTDEAALTKLAHGLVVSFNTDPAGELGAYLEGKNVTPALRTEACGQLASQISAFPQVRQALLEKQRSFCRLPGLVTDGRDMGTIVFPDADLKIFLLASAEERAQRRYKQLNNKGISVNLDKILAELIERDRRDSERTVSPLKPAPDSVFLDSSGLSINEVLEGALAFAREKGLFTD